MLQEQFYYRVMIASLSFVQRSELKLKTTTTVSSRSFEWFSTFSVNKITLSCIYLNDFRFFKEQRLIMHRQIKAYSSPLKLIIPITSLVLTAHIPLTSLSRSGYFSTFTSSLALTLPSSGIVIIMLWQLSSFCRCSLSLLASLPWYVPSRKPHNGLYLHFQAHFLEHGHTTSHFAQTHIFLKGPNERPQPHCHVSFCIIFVYISSAHELTIWLIVLLLCLHIIMVTSSVSCFILSYFLRGYQKPLAKINIQLKILMERRIIIINV